MVWLTLGLLAVMICIGIARWFGTKEPGCEHLHPMHDGEVLSKTVTALQRFVSSDGQ